MATVSSYTRTITCRRQNGNTFARKVSYKYPYAMLEVGDSFEVSLHQNWRSAQEATYRYGRDNGLTFSSRLDRGAGLVRITREA